MSEDSWAEAAPTWDTDPYVVAYANAAFESLQAAVTLSADTRVLDFGCGTGLLAERLAPHVHEVVAVDASAAMVEVLSAKSLPNVKSLAATWTPANLPNDLGRFHLVVCSSVCAFLDDYPGTAAMLASLLHPGGHFVQWDWELDPSAEEPMGLTAPTIREALERAGLEVVSVGQGFDCRVEGTTMRPLMGVGRTR